MAKYFYKDNETGRLKKYIGNVEERDGNLYGKLISHKVNYSTSELKQIEEHQTVASKHSYLVWKDKFGVEHELNDSDNVYNNQVIDKRDYSLQVKYFPAKDEETIYFRKDTKEQFNGEVVEKDGKYFGKL